jgi:hydroxylamine dehydrogenase
MRSAFSWALRTLLSLSLLFPVLAVRPIAAQTATSAQCLDCHSKLTPNIVSDWKLSKHSGVEVTCVTCHGDQHSSASDVTKVKIPTPETCAQCHETQVAQFHKGKHATAWASMKAMPTIHWQPMAMTQGEKVAADATRLATRL